MGKKDDNDEQIEEVAKLLKQLTDTDSKKEEKEDEVLEFTELLQEIVAGEPITEEPAAEEPITEEPAAEEPVTEEPAAEDPVTEEPAAEEPITEEPAAEDPVTEEPAAEEPITEEPVAEKPAENQPSNTETKADRTVKRKTVAVKKTSKIAQERREKVKPVEEKEPEVVKLTPGKMAANLVRKIIFCTSLGVFSFALTSLLVLLWGYYVSQREYEQINEEYVVIGTATAPENSGDDEDGTDTVVNVSANDADGAESSVPFLDITVDERKLRALNEDYAFYIVVPGTNVQYPVVQGDDNNHYLRYTYSNQENTAGAIEVDYRTDKDSYLQVFKTIILGHNRQDGTMFSDMAQYKDESFRDENPYIYIILGDQEYVYEIFAFYETSPIGICYNPNTDDSQYLDFINENNTYTGDIEVTLEDRIITLYTCNEDSSMRYLIHAVLREVYDLS